MWFDKTALNQYFNILTVYECIILKYQKRDTVIVYKIHLQLPCSLFKETFP